MDLDAYVAVHRGEWVRLEQLLRRSSSLRGIEVDELVDLYARVGTHLSAVRAAAPDPALVAHLSQLVGSARGSITGTPDPGIRDLRRFLLVGFPGAVYRARWWILGSTVASLALAGALGWWIGDSEVVQRSIAQPDAVSQLVNHDFEDYYSRNNQGAFAAQVWTNNAWISAQCLVLGVTVVWVLFTLFQNAVNLGVAAGFMAAYGKLGLFFSLILPHGMLELTAVFVAAGAGLRVGWAWIDPGRLTRGRAVAQQGRAALVMAIGLTGVLFVSALLEAFVTPSPLPTWARIGVGAMAEVGFLTYVAVFGRRAVRAGDVGDREELAQSYAPSAG